MGSIPALEYTIHHSTDRLRRQHLYYEEEILKTRALFMGDVEADPDLSVSYGIVSATDPTTHLAGSTDPLVVSVNAQNQLTVDVNPGTAVMSSGCWVELHSTVRQVSLAESGVDVPNVVYLQYLLDLAPDEPNDFLQPVPPYTVRVGDQLNDGTIPNTQDILIGVLKAESFTDLAPSELANIVPLAVATVQTVDSGGGVLVNQLTIDHTDASYDFNRPWFSVVDHVHRSQVGTGTVTSTNPHGISGNDWTIGDLSALQVHLDHGMLVAKDRSLAKVPGYRCESAITTVDVDDASGTLTGFPNASYISLPYFPVRVGRVEYASTSSAIAALHVPQTHRVVFPYETPTAGETLNVYYTRAEALEPPLPGNTIFRTNGPAEQELPIAGGIGLVSLTTTEEDFSDAYQIPMRYEMFVDGNGDVLKTPQVVYCYKRLAELGTSDNADDITPYGPGRLLVGLAGANDVPGLDVQIRIYGTDTNGTTIDELFTFNSVSWSPVPAIPSLPEPNASFLAFGTTVFATLTTITVEVKSNDGPNSAVMVWMAQHSYSNYDTQADAMHVASVDWDGYSMGRIFDKRVVATTLRDELNSASNANMQELTYSLLAGGNATVFIEDFRRPRYHSLETPDELSATLGRYPTYNFSKQQVGLHGYYQSIAFPVHTNSGTTWRVSLFGAENIVDPWFPNQPILVAYESGAWVVHSMTAVPGVPDTWEATTSAVPTRVQVQLYPGQCYGMAIYG